MRSKRAVAVGIVAVAAAIVVVIGAVILSGSDATAPIGAIAAVQDDHLPIPETPIAAIPDRLDLLAATGVTTTRVDLFWSAIATTRPTTAADPADPAYDFSRADVIMQGLAQRNITPIVTVYSTPAWDSADKVDGTPGPVNRLAPDPADYGAFMGAVATRYSGHFVAPGGETLPAARYYEIWNEPNLSGFLIPAPLEAGASLEQITQARLDLYAAMDRAATSTIKAANPNAVIIVGVGGPRSSTSPKGVSALDWLAGLRALDIPLDAYSQHVYPSAAPTVDTTVVPSWSSIGRVLDALDEWRADIPLYITEAGYTTQPTAYRNGFVTEAEQAEYLGQIYSLPQLRTDRIKAVVWFNLEDNAGWPAGLLRDTTLEKKPSYARFLQVVKDQKGARLP